MEIIKNKIERVSNIQGNNIQVSNIHEYLDVINRYKSYTGVFYRGQSEKHQDITASISRNPGFVKNEYAFYQEAIRMITLEFEGLTSPIERLAKMQHYGIPTRLIDLSIDPLIALFFAVKDVTSEFAAKVYVYLQKKHTLLDKKVKLLAMLATIDSYEIEKIAKSYFDEYNEEITKAEILDFASQCAFIEHSDRLKKSNERLFSQRGTFAICGNIVEGEIIQRSIKQLDSVNPALIINIPFRDKSALKLELDERYNINETTIFPEFPSVADYLKEKYKALDPKFISNYSIIEAKDISTLRAKRISVIAVLNKELKIEDTKLVGVEIISKYKEEYDVIWVYIAQNGDDYIIGNWIVRAQWINAELEWQYRPIEIAPPDEQGYHWQI